MAARTDADGEDYTRTLSLGAITALTVAGWFRLVVDRNNYSSPFFVDNGMGDNWGMQTGVDGTTMASVFDGTTQQGIGAMSVGTWYYLCLSTSGTSGNIFYRTAAQSALTTVAVTGVTANVTATTLRIGASPWGGEWWHGDFANVCMWSAALTVGEAYNESVRYVPYRYANLVGWYPFLRPETTDYSGNGRTLSGGAGATLIDGPPIPWYTASRPRLVLPASGGGSPINVALNRASETGTVGALTRSKSVAFGRTTTADTVRAMIASKNVPLSRATQTDLTRLLTPSKLVTLPRSTETDAARSLTRSKLVPLTRTTDTSVARPLMPSKVVSLGRVTDTSIARSLTKHTLWFLLRATSTESVRSLNVARNVPLVRVVETGTARTLSAGQPVFATIGRAIETGTVRGLAIVKHAALGRVVDASAARALTIAHSAVLGRAVETDVVRTLGTSRAVLLGRVVEIDAARALTLQKIVHLVRVTAADVVGSLSTTQGSIAIDVDHGDSALDLVDVDYGTPVRLVQASSGLLVVMFTSTPGERA